MKQSGTICFCLFLFLLLFVCTYSEVMVIPEHPRLYFRSNPWVDGPNLSDLRQKALQQEFIFRKEELSKATSDTGYYDMLNNALKYLLYDDTLAADRALSLLLKCNRTQVVASYESQEMREAAVAYDWLFHYPKFNDDKKSEVVQTLLAFAQDCNDYLTESSREPHIWHTRTPTTAAALGTIALALYGDDSAATGLLDKCLTYWDSVYYPALVYQDGGTANGTSYGFFHGIRSEILFLCALKSATGRDCFTEWPVLRRQFDYFLYNILPDMGWVKKDDIAPHSYMTFRQARSVVDIFSAQYPVSDGPLMSRKLGDYWGLRDYMVCKDSLNGSAIYQGSYLYAYFIWNNPDKPPDAEIKLSRTECFGKQSIGQIYLRSGWNNEDVCFFYRCGDYFEDHGHFDQGLFTLFMGAPLAVRHGQWGDKTAGFANTLVFNTAGTQRSMSVQNAITLDDYLTKKRTRKLETGDITGFWANDSLVYITSDVTAANNSAECLKHKRDILSIRNRTFIILDQFSVPSNSIKPRWLFHSVDSPSISEHGFSITNSDLTSNIYGLEVRVLLPENPVFNVSRSVFKDSLSGAGVAGKDTMNHSACLNGWVTSFSDSLRATKNIFISVLEPYQLGAPHRGMASLVLKDSHQIKVSVAEDTFTFLNTGNGDYLFDSTRIIGIERFTNVKNMAPGLYCSPNPFNEVVSIKWMIHDLLLNESSVCFKIYNATGTLMKTLKPMHQATFLTALWDGRRDNGSKLPSGIYVIQAEYPGKKLTRRLVLVR